MVAATFFEKVTVTIRVTFLLFVLLAGVPLFSQSAMSLDETVSALGGAGKVELRWDPFLASGILVAGEREAAFVSGRVGESGMVLLDHREVLTLPLPYLERGILRFPELFVNQVGRSFGLYTDEYNNNNDNSDKFRIAAIIIDPGHGGKDPGATATHTINGKTIDSVEKEIALKTSRMLYASLVAAYPDKKIIITREGDTFLTLDERVDIANTVTLKKNEAAIFVSVHANSALTNTARGFEVWYLSPSFRREVIDRKLYPDSEEILPILNSMLEEELTTESILLADAILKRLEEAIGKQTLSRGLKAEEWFVVKNARMPSVLVELGFVSNETEALMMNDEAHLKKVSDALYKGISDFVTFFERSGGLTIPQ
ncbi:MAG: N-acetylmuramoyl-L-alanine amidase [Treponema sp.]|jgi:N-acetylmuramoyl-L-alanine amidase|nr:N-acetylmuramoyl-L-alanine amidase [Treponema sp.]